MAVTNRVIKLDRRRLWEAFRKKRDERGLNTRTLIDEAVSRYLSDIKASLIAIGLGDASKGDFPVKVEIDMANIMELNEASNATGVPAVRLLRLCLLRLTAENPKPKGRKGKRTTKKTVTKKRTTKGGSK
jgi:hypothetical protein